MFNRSSGNVQKESRKCSRRLQGICERIPGNIKKDSGIVQEDSGESKFRFILRNLAYFLSNSAIILRQNKRIFCTLVLTSYWSSYWSFLRIFLHIIFCSALCISLYISIVIKHVTVSVVAKWQFQVAALYSFL